MDKNERDEKIELYGRGFDLLKAALDEVPQEAMKFKSEPKEWSVYEVIIHIADSESNAALRARKLIVEPGGTIMGYDQALWADMLKYHDHNFEDARRDHNKWGPLVRIGGYIIHHDMASQREFATQWQDLARLRKDILWRQRECLDLATEVGSMAVFRRRLGAWVDA